MERIVNSYSCIVTLFMYTGLSIRGRYEKLFFMYIILYIFIWASQVALVLKNPPANAGGIRDAVQSLGRESPLEKGMATHSSILTWKIPMDRGAWRATVHGAAKSQT